MLSTLILNALVVNEGETFTADLLIENSVIAKIFRDGSKGSISNASRIIDASGKLLIPGIIDDQVHFREPGLTNKADIFSESRAGVAGGVTSFMDMPNTKPAATTLDLLEEKYAIASQKSAANYSFYFGATNDNSDELKQIDPKRICGVKVFMGASTGSMLVDREQALEAIFSTSPILVATHCEDEATIREKTNFFKEKYGESVPFSCHPLIRTREACFKSTFKAIQLAEKFGTRLHVLHLSTADELPLFEPYAKIPLSQKQVTAEVCVHHLWFCDESYAEKGALIKCNPAIKSANDRSSLIQAVDQGVIDIVATDHAPHTLAEKAGSYFSTPSGLPLIQFSLSAMLELYHQGKLRLETIVERMCHAPATLFQVAQRGYIREGYKADIVLVDITNPFTVKQEDVLSKCGWSPFEGLTFTSKVSHTFVNGKLAYENGKIVNSTPGERLEFSR